MERVGFGPRFLAALIDGVSLLIVLSILGAIFGMSATVAFGGNTGGFSILAIILSLIPLGYSTTEIFQAATPGKQLMKLKIKNEDGTDADENVLKKRWAIKWSGFLISMIGTITTLSIFSVLGTLVGLIVFLGTFLVLTEGFQTLADKLAKTAVYKIG